MQKLQLVVVAAGWLILSGCGTNTLEDKTGTLLFTANGEDFVRQGFVSEDGWAISFDSVTINVEGPTAYQVVESQTRAQQTTRHGGHPHESVPEGSAHVALTGEYLLELTGEVMTVGSVEDAPIGNYNRMAFNLKSLEEGHTIQMIGRATKDSQVVDFDIRFSEDMHYHACGPNGTAGVLAEDGQATAEMTFHFDHIFGDFEEGDPQPDDQSLINFIAVGFQPFADLAETRGILDIDQERLGQLMTGATYLQLIEAVRTLGHSGEGHCLLE